MSERKKLKYLIKSEHKLSQDTINALTEGIKAFNEGKTDVLIVNPALSVVVVDENNDYVTML